MNADLFNDAAALLPVVILAKVADRHRRQAQGRLASPMLLHQLFIASALLGLVLAVVGAAELASRAVLAFALLPLLGICGFFFAGELLRSDDATTPGRVPSWLPEAVRSGFSRST